MKLETQRDRWQALLDGAWLTNGYRIIRMGDAHLEQSFDDGKLWGQSTMALFQEEWQLYKPPTKPSVTSTAKAYCFTRHEPPTAKPENKVIKIIYNPVYKIYTVGFPKLVQEEYTTENDAIRAAMTWIGEKAKSVQINHPAWVRTIDKCYKTDGQFWCTQVELFLMALKLRWPIEVIEEV